MRLLLLTERIAQKEEKSNFFLEHKRNYIYFVPANVSDRQHFCRVFPIARKEQTAI